MSVRIQPFALTIIKNNNNHHNYDNNIYIDNRKNLLHYGNNVVILLITIVYILSNHIGLCLKESPFLVEKTERLTVNKGENVILNCAFEYPDKTPVSYVIQWIKGSSDLPLYIWYDGYPPHTGPGYEGRASLYGQASLNLTQVREEDQGLYYCKIFFLNRPAKSPVNASKIYLEVHAPPHFKVKPPDTVYTKFGEFISLPCEAVGTPPPVLYWIKDREKVTPNSNLKIGKSSELLIGPVQQTNIGEYACVARNQEGEVRSAARVVLAGPARIIRPPQNLTLPEGREVEFPCSAKALPSNVTVTWYYNGTEITAEDTNQLQNRWSIKSDGSLVIRSIDPDDSGHYRCTVYNGIGTPDSASAWLNVEFPARIYNTPELQFLPLGLSGMIKCHIRANPPIQWIDWTKDSRRIEERSSTNLIDMKNGSLRILRVTHKDQGQYTCVPYNKHGTASAPKTIQVIVRDPPVFTVKPEPEYSVQVNGEIKIPCQGVGQGIPKKGGNWRRSGGLPLPSQRAKVYDNYLEIKSIKKEDTGRYECYLQNDVATIIASTRLLVESTTPHAPTNVSVNTSAFAATVTWQPSYDGGYEQSYKIWYRQLDGSDSTWKTIRVYPEGSTAFTLFKLQPDTEYEFQVYSHNTVGDGEGSPIVRARTKAHDPSRNPSLSIDSHGSSYLPDLAKSTGIRLGPPYDLRIEKVAQGYSIRWKINPGPQMASNFTVICKLRRDKMDPLVSVNDTTRENKYLVKIFKPGEFYEIIVIANFESFPPSSSQPFKYEVPGNSRHSKDKAIAAGVVGGILFFIAAIVLSVCTVKICNERKRRKAEKAYLMVTCPIMSVTGDGHPHGDSPMPLKSYDESGIPGLANGQQYTTYEWETNRGYQDE
ncbi:protein turtle-like isoform X2 [Brevipalpus obovatus]|uniref:protein turtle-like isoform X2 n=1 Tax=Brevipalpus obovatus TaxID=246614 RepID=UPI003D9EDBC1